MKKIIVLLLTKENEEQFVLAENVIRNTWAKNNNKNCEIWYYYGDSPEFLVDNNVIRCNIPEGFPNIGKKTICAFEYLLNLEFDFILRANSSSYVNINKLVDYVQNLPTEKYYGGSPIHFYGGGITEEDLLNPPKNCAHGCGFLLSRDLVRLIVENQDKWGHHMIDDMALCKFMKVFNVELTEYPRLEVSRYENDVMYNQHEVEISETELKENFFVRTRTREMNRNNEVKIIEKCYRMEKKNKILVQVGSSDGNDEFDKINH
jgi:hypothetical protein